MKQRLHDKNKSRGRFVKTGHINQKIRSYERKHNYRVKVKRELKQRKVELCVCRVATLNKERHQ